MIEGSITRILGEVVRSVELKTATTIQMDAEMVVPSVVNDPGVARVAAAAAESILGADALTDAPPSMGGDDFAWYLRDVPGCYVFVGERVAERAAYGWHDAAYDLDERSLPVGSAVLVAMVHRIAKEGWG